MSAKRWSWVAAIAIGVVAVGWALRPAPLTVDVAAVDRGPLTVAIAEEGTTRVIERFVVATPVTGRLRRIELAAGDSVEAGTVVARLEPAPLDPRTRQELAARLEADGIAVIGITDHTIFKSIYFFDPNGHRLELAADTATPAMQHKLDDVKWAMLEEWSRTKRAPKHAAWMHEKEFAAS